MTGIGLAHGEVNLSDQGTTVFIGSLLAAAFLMLCWSISRQKSLQGKRDELDREREQLYAARAALDLESERLCRESDVNDRKRDEKAQLERENGLRALERERVATNAQYANSIAEVEANAYKKGLEHAQRGFVDDGPGDGNVIHLPITWRPLDTHTPRAGEH
ncbi:hypothetical protein [Streptacidiphilus sp. PAMC 29251]